MKDKCIRDIHHFENTQIYLLWGSKHRISEEINKLHLDLSEDNRLLWKSLNWWLRSAGTPLGISINTKHVANSGQGRQKESGDQDCLVGAALWWKVVNMLFKTPICCTELGVESWIHFQSRVLLMSIMGGSRWRLESLHPWHFLWETWRILASICLNPGYCGHLESWTSGWKCPYVCLTFKLVITNTCKHL